MLITKLNRRYAKSLIDFAREMDKVEDVKQDVDRIIEVVDGSRDFRVMLKSPVIGPDKKEKVMEAVFAGELTEITANFIKILIRKGREGQLEETFRAFRELYRASKGIEQAMITTAQPLSEEQREEIRAKLAEVTSHEIEITEKVDASLIGGMKVRVGDRQYNGSIAFQLEQLRRRFKKNDFVPDF